MTSVSKEIIFILVLPALSVTCLNKNKTNLCNCFREFILTYRTYFFNSNFKNLYITT